MATLPGQRGACADGGKWNEMEPNGTELKDSPLLATRDEAKRGQGGFMLAQCVGVSGVPNEATVASFSASPLGVNRTR